MRPRKPTKQKRLEGNPGKRDITDEPDAIGTPRKPRDLSGEASKCWDAITPQVVANGSGAADSMRIAGLCRWYGRYMDAETLLSGMSLEDKAAYRLVVLAAMAWKQFDSAASKFGLSPSDRARLKVPATNSDDPLKRFGITG